MNGRGSPRKHEYIARTRVVTKKQVMNLINITRSAMYTWAWSILNGWSLQLFDCSFGVVHLLSLGIPRQSGVLQ